MTEVARLLLAGVLAVAGIAKLLDRAGSRQAAASFGLPAALAGPVALVLPLVELAIAGALVPAPSARVAAAAALALLLSFSLGIALALLRGRSPDCHCFGRLHSAPAGRGTLLRNGALAAVALLVLLRPGSGPSWLAAAGAGLVALVAGQALLSVVVLRRYGTALRRIDELEGAGAAVPAAMVGADAPRFSLPGVDGSMTSLDDLLVPGRSLLLVFVHPACGPCRALLEGVASWRRVGLERLGVAVVSRGDLETNRVLAEEHGIDVLLVQEDREVAALYGVEATPSALLLDAGGAIERPLAVGAPAIEDLVSAVAPAEQPAASVSPAVRARPAVAALAGSVAVAGVTAGAALGRASQLPSDPELAAIVQACQAASPRLRRAAERSRSAVRAQATLRQGPAVRKKRTRAARALAAQRREVLALRQRLDALESSGVAAHNAKVMLLSGLSLLASSIRARERALTASPKAARRLAGESQKLLLESLAVLAGVGRVLERA